MADSATIEVSGKFGDEVAPEWAARLLTINEVGEITRESRATIYRKIRAGIYPGNLRFGGSSRMRGWELWRLLHEAA